MTSRYNRLPKSLLGAAIAAALLPAGAYASTFNWNSGDFAPGVTAPHPLTTLDFLDIGAGGVKRFVGTTFTNQSLVRWLADPLQGGNGAVVNNAGEWRSQSDANSLTHNFGGQPLFVNSGSFSKTAGAITNVGGWLFRNDGGLIDAQVGTIRFNGGSNIFNAGSRFSGAGAVVIAGASTFNGAFQSDNLSHSGGSVQGNAAVLSGGAGLSAGLMAWSGGDFTGTWTLSAGTTLSASSGATKRFVGTSFVNDGTFRWSTTDTLQNGNGSSFTNNGLTEVTESALFEYSFGGPPAFTNAASGIVRATNNATFTIGNLTLTSNGGLFAADTGSAIRVIGNTNRFNDGTRFVGDQRMQGTARFVDTIHSDNLRFVGGTQIGGDGVTPGSRAHLAGVVSYEGGDLSGAWTIANGATVTAIDGGVKRLLGAAIVNDGTFRWSTTNTLQNGNSSSFTNNGLTEVTESALFEYSFGSPPAFTNAASGTVRSTNNATFTIGNLALTSNGGLFQALPGAQINFAGNSNRFNAGTRFDGNIRISGNSRFVDQIEANGLRLVGGTQTGGDGSPGSVGRLGGSLAWEAGDLSGNFELRNGATLTATGAGNKRQVGSQLVNNGTIVWASDGILQGGNSSRLSNNGRFEIASDADIVWIFGGQAALDNTGLLIKTAGAGDSSLASLALTNTGTIDVRSGSISLPNNFVNAGTLMGTGAFNVAGTLLNNGHIAPGASPGTLTLNGSFQQSTLGSFDVELENSLSHDLFLISGNATLAGTLGLSCFASCSYAVGDEIVILDAIGQLSGSFTSVLMSGFTSGAFDVIYDTVNDRVLLRATEIVTAAVPLPGSVNLMLGGLVLLGVMFKRRRA